MTDIHVHSIYSDGEYTPFEILEICHKRGISTLAITDHNSMEGSKQAILNNPYKDITVISGIELGAASPVKSGTLHILGYNIDVENNALNEVTKAIMSDNVMRLKSCVDLLKKHYGLSFREQDLEKIFESVGNIGRPDIAKLCVKYGYSTSVQEAFKSYISPIKDEIIKRRVELTAKEAIEYIVNAHGTPCLAHPIELKLDFDTLKQYIRELMSYGLEAVEVYQSKHVAEYTLRLEKLVCKHNLLTSIGSDYHGPCVTPDFEIGFGKNYNLLGKSATILSKILR